MAPDKETLEVVWPRAKKVVESSVFAGRYGSLEGKTIGELWDRIFRGDELFPLIETELEKRYPGIKFVNHEVFGNTHGSKEAQTIAALPQKLKENECDAVISGMGC